MTKATSQNDSDDAEKAKQNPLATILLIGSGEGAKRLAQAISDACITLARVDLDLWGELLHAADVTDNPRLALHVYCQLMEDQNERTKANQTD